MVDRAKLAQLGIDMEEGLAYCADDAEFYVEMLQEYVDEHPAKHEELERFAGERDWANYAIRVHSVKSTSRMIGAAPLSERARELELASRDCDGARILEAHPAFLAAYDGLVAQLRELLA